jgi:hypothetical protein
MMIVKELGKQRYAPRVFSEVFYLKILFEKLNLFLKSSSLKLVITVKRTEFSDPRNEFPITRKLKTRFCDQAGDKAGFPVESEIKLKTDSDSGENRRP